MSRTKTITGQQGVEAVISELSDKGYKVRSMPNHNKGFDLECQSPEGRSFRVEVKTSTSDKNQVPIQLHFLDCVLTPELFFVLVKKHDAAPFFEYYVLTHEELKAAWVLMPKHKMNKEPYVINTPYIDWRLVELQRNRWYKLPK